MQEFPTFQKERGLMMARPVISNALFDEDAVPLLKSDRQYDGRPMGSQDFRSQHEYMGSQDFHSRNSPDDSYQ